MIREHYRWILFPKAAINGGAKSGLAWRVVPYQRTAIGSALECKEKVGPVVREKSERSIEIWGMIDDLRGPSVMRTAMASFDHCSTSAFASRSRLLDKEFCSCYRQEVLRNVTCMADADHAEPHVLVSTCKLAWIRDPNRTIGCSVLSHDGPRYRRRSRGIVCMQQPRSYSLVQGSSCNFWLIQQAFPVVPVVRPDRVVSGRQQIQCLLG